MNQLNFICKKFSRIIIGTVIYKEGISEESRFDVARIVKLRTHYQICVMNLDVE